MPPIPIYLLLTNFLESDIALFRAKYLKGMVQSSEYYEYPPYTNETVFETSSVDEMMNFMLEGGKGEFRFYFRSEDGSRFKNGMIFFNTDNSLVFGVDVYPDALGSEAQTLRQDFKQDFKSDHFLVYGEAVPPDNAEDFIAAINGSDFR